MIASHASHASYASHASHARPSVVNGYLGPVVLQCNERRSSAVRKSRMHTATQQCTTWKAVGTLLRVFCYLEKDALLLSAGQMLKTHCQFQNHVQSATVTLLIFLMVYRRSIQGVLVFCPASFAHRRVYLSVIWISHSIPLQGEVSASQCFGTTTAGRRVLAERVLPCSLFHPFFFSFLRPFYALFLFFFPFLFFFWVHIVPWGLSRRLCPF